MPQIVERMIDQRAHRFGGIAAAPVGHAEPIADLRTVIAEVDAATADQLAFSGDDECGSTVSPVRRSGDGSVRIVDAVRMRKTRRVRRDAHVIGKVRDGRCVLALRRTQNEPLGRQRGNAEIPPRRAEFLFREGHGMGSCRKNRKGEPAFRSPPFRSPFGPAGD